VLGSALEQAYYVLQIKGCTYTKPIEIRPTLSAKIEEDISVDLAGIQLWLVA
jgi:hypothetical protein